MRRMITGKDAEIFKNIAADGTKTVVSGDLDVNGNITKNGQPIGGGSKEKVIFTVFTASDSSSGITILAANTAANDKLAKVKVGDVISIVRKEGSTIKEVVTLTCVTNEMPFNGMGQHFTCKGSGYCDNGSVYNICSAYIDLASSGTDGRPYLYLSNTASASTQYYTTIAKGDKVEIYF